MSEPELSPFIVLAVTRARSTPKEFPRIASMVTARMKYLNRNEKKAWAEVERTYMLEQAHVELMKTVLKTGR